MADSPLRHGWVLPDWLVNSHNQIPAPSGGAGGGLPRGGMIGQVTETGLSSYPHHPFVVKPLPRCQLVSVWVVKSEKKKGAFLDVIV